MGQFSFSRLPNKWIQDGLLVSFKGGADQGRSIAALKIVILFALKNGFSDRIDNLSFSIISESTGLSRPMLSPAIEQLEGLGLILVDRRTRTHSYSLNVDLRATWARLPRFLLLERLPLLSNRSSSTLYALKIYLVLHAYRSNYSMSVTITYTKLREKTGLQPKNIRKGIDVLINHGLIGLSRLKGPDGSYQANCYSFFGLQLPKERQ